MRFATLLAAATLSLGVRAHQGHDAAKEIAARREYLANNVGHLDHCQEMHSRGLHRRAMERRAEYATRLSKPGHVHSRKRDAMK
jgi:hypothetical protein